MSGGGTTLEVKREKGRPRQHRADTIKSGLIKCTQKITIEDSVHGDKWRNVVETESPSRIVKA